MKTSSWVLLAVLSFSLIGCEQNYQPAPPTPVKPPQERPGEESEPSQVDWAQPPVACAEEIIPHPAQRACLDLTQVKDVFKDWPAGITEEDMTYWTTQRRGLDFCRSKELLRREELLPGSYSSGNVQLAWMRVLAIDFYQTKIDAVYEASRTYGMPTQILAGALFQESLFSQLGIAADGGNYSCGIGQINVSEWCAWAVKQSDQKKLEMGFPWGAVNCSQAQLAFVKPLYEIALTKLNGAPEYKLMPDHFAGIALDDVVSSFPPATREIQEQRFQMVTSFLGNCRDPHDGIMAKAHQIADIYRRYVPAGIKEHDLYASGEKYQRSCRGGGEEKYHPVGASWLLAVGVYNAGPRAVDAMAFYNRWTKEQLDLADSFADFDPVKMVESFYWGGWYSAVDDKIHFIGRNGQELTWDWFKGCVLQRHIARVVQHATLPGTPKYIDSLENGIACKRSSVDPVTGELVSGVPDFRKVSSGQK